MTSGDLVSYAGEAFPGATRFLGLTQVQRLADAVMRVCPGEPVGQTDPLTSERQRAATQGRVVPSGPASEIPLRTGTYGSYLAWRETVDGDLAWRWIVEQALLAFERRERRISSRTLVARCRDALHIRINDHFTAWIADDLVDRWSALSAVVERRRRRKVKL